MTKKEFCELPIGAILYNDKEGEIVKISSGFAASKEVKDDDYRSIDDIFSEGFSDWQFPRKRWGIDVKNCEEWEVYKSIDQVQNVNLKYKILQREIELLRHIVHKHLRVDSQFTNLI